MPARSLKDGTLVIVDGTSPTPNTLTIPILDGDIQWDEPDEGVVVKNRGSMTGAEWIDGEDMPIPVTFSLTFEEWQGKNSGNPSPHDALKKLGNAASWASVATSGPYVVDLRYTIADTEVSGGQNERIVFGKFKAENVSFQAGYPNKLEVRGRALSLTPTRAV